MVMCFPAHVGGLIGRNADWLNLRDVRLIGLDLRDRFLGRIKPFQQSLSFGFQPFIQRFNSFVITLDLSRQTLAAIDQQTAVDSGNAIGEVIESIGKSEFVRGKEGLDRGRVFAQRCGKFVGIKVQLSLVIKSKPDLANRSQAAGTDHGARQESGVAVFDPQCLAGTKQQSDLVGVGIKKGQRIEFFDQGVELVNERLGRGDHGIRIFGNRHGDRRIGKLFQSQHESGAVQIIGVGCGSNQGRHRSPVDRLRRRGAGDAEISGARSRSDVGDR